MSTDPYNQRWFWTERWQEGKWQASEQITTSGLRAYDDMESSFADIVFGQPMSGKNQNMNNCPNLPDHVTRHLDEIKRNAQFKRDTAEKNDTPAREALRNFTLRIAGHTGSPPFTEQGVKDRRELLDEMWSLVHEVMAVELRRHAENINNWADELDPDRRAW